MLQLSFTDVLRERLGEPHPLIQVILGPRQVGKTTGVRQVLKTLKFSHVYFSADDVVAADRSLLLEQWQKAKLLGPGAVLVIDEIQKIPNWSEVIKKLWDAEDKKRRIKCVLLGSASLTLQKGLSESLTGRFEEIRVPHWNFADSKRAFGLSLDQYLNFGGYPGSYEFIKDPERWRAYVQGAIIETVIGKDILGQRTVAKPALFRQAFAILSHYPAQEISYTKLLGQLQDKGNTDLIKHYIELYEGAFLFRALHKYSAKPTLRKSSSPKILPLCPALHTVTQSSDVASESEKRGRLVELAVGMELTRLPGELYYWREGPYEVDYIRAHGGMITAIEVKSGRKTSGKGLDAFLTKFPKAKPVIVTEDLLARLSKDGEEFFKAI